MDPITPLTPEQTAQQEAQAASEGYVKRDLIAIDMAANVLTDGLPDETISSRLARDAEKGSEVGKIGSEILDKFQADHGAKAVAGDESRAEAVAAVETDSGIIE